MEEYKICPVCETKNSPDAELCDCCGADVSGEPITSDIRQSAQEKDADMNGHTADEKPGNHIDLLADEDNVFRVCDECSYLNPRNARKCHSCGSDISDIIPTIVHRKAENIKFELRSEDGAVSFSIPEGETIIGREYELKDYLKARMFVSRKHGKLINENGAVYYEDLSSTNGSLLNQKRVSETRVRLINGDRLYLGHNPDLLNNDKSKIAYFIFIQ